MEEHGLQPCRQGPRSDSGPARVLQRVGPCVLICSWKHDLGDANENIGILDLAIDEGPFRRSIHQLVKHFLRDTLVLVYAAVLVLNLQRLSVSVVANHRNTGRRHRKPLHALPLSPLHCLFACLLLNSPAGDCRVKFRRFHSRSLPAFSHFRIIAARTRIDQRDPYA